MSFEAPAASGNRTWQPLDVREQTFTCDIGGQTMTFKAGKLAQLAGGAVTVTLGDTVVMATATASAHPRPGIDFFPLSVDIEEKLYAAGRIPGSFFRREGRPSEVAILNARLIDRPLRPLFPKTFRNEVQIIATALSSDGENYIDIPALNASSAALVISDIPFAEPVAGVRLGMVDGEFQVNPTAAQMEGSRLDLRVAGTADAILMVECGAEQVDEDTMVRAIHHAHRAMQPIIELQRRMREALGKAKRAFPEAVEAADLEASARGFIGDRVDRAFDENHDKTSRSAAVDALREEWVGRFEVAEGETPERDPKEVMAAFDKIYKERVRRRILDRGVRPDGRRPDEIRALHTEVNLLPRTHGSGLFQRGETQVLTLATLGTLGEEQRLDTLRPEGTKRFMHHYNFPPFSTGETWFLRGPKRREIGHGALAETALRPVIPAPDDFPYAIRLVSEVLMSNGSSSMGSVCASTLSLMDAGVPISAPVAGIAMGLVTDPADPGSYQILTDIQGMEDALGDMDFKVAGTAAGITALQMDIKLKGLPEAVLRQALAQAREARLTLLDNMLQTLSEPRTEMSPYAPRITSVKIDPESIGKLIGPGGKTIRAIQEQTGVKIDVQDDGTVHIASVEGAEGANLAMAMIEGLTATPQLGKIYTGTVSRVVDFGAFVEILPGQDGLVHISQMAEERVDSVESVVSVGDEILVMVTDVSDGKVRLSRQAVLAGWTLEEAREHDAGIGGRGGGGGRSGGGRGGDRRGGGGGDRRGGGGYQRR
ncbi:MAG: polyribonucleotide nucleotidyltransferase [Caldilineae bacterium]|nr:polyribonucleotide nucleotidyltransferase [Chloroflexota bacterium]MCB9177506.1 polyribonucleotide nucleotidyltransferase [Caldilineae bacterium]